MILFLSLSAPDYFEPMYTTVFGRFAMTVVIVGIAFATFIAERIMKLEV